MDSNANLYGFVCGDAGQAFQGIALQLVQQSDDIAIDFVLAALSLTTRFGTALLKPFDASRHYSIPILSPDVLHSVEKLQMESFACFRPPSAETSLIV